MFSTGQKFLWTNPLKQLLLICVWKATFAWFGNNILLIAGLSLSANGFASKLAEIDFNLGLFCPFSYF